MGMSRSHFVTRSAGFFMVFNVPKEDSYWHCAVCHLLSRFWLAWRSWHLWQRLLVGVAGRLWHRTQTPALTSRS